MGQIEVRAAESTGPETVRAGGQYGALLPHAGPPAAPGHVNLSDRSDKQGCGATAAMAAPQSAPHNLEQLRIDDQEPDGFGAWVRYLRDVNLRTRRPA